MSGQPSRSKSNRTTPPLIKSMVYFFWGSDVCLKLMPAWEVMSENCGTGRPLQYFVFVPTGAGGGSGCPVCARPMRPSDVAKSIASNSACGQLLINCFGLLERRVTDDLPTLKSVSLLKRL